MADFELNVRVNGVEQSVSTIGALEQALAETNAELMKVESNSKEFGFLKNQAQNLEKVLGALTSDANGLSQGLKNVDNSAKSLGQTFNSAAQAATNLQETNTGQLSQNIQTAATTAASLRTELRQIITELQNLEPGSARFQELSVRAGQLRDQIGDTNATVTALAGNTTERLGTALQGTAQIGVAGFQAIAGAQALFGVKSEAAAETMVKLQALLNLSQAIQQFGGLRDQITNITAGFKSLIPSVTGAAAGTTALATAEGAEAVAATGAATATGAFATALNALPLVAIVTALGLLVAGLINYFNKADEAEEAEKKRNEELKKQEEQIKATTEATAQEGSELFILLQRLKATNAGSKERSSLISEINSSYGLTLKNLKDEKAFQDQVTKSTEDYIEQLKNKVALQLIEQQATVLLTERLSLEKSLEDQTRKSTTAGIFFNKTLQTSIPALGNFNSSLQIQDGFLRDITDAKNRDLQVTNAKFAADKNAADIAIRNAKNRRDQIDAELKDLATEANNYKQQLTGAFELIDKGSKGTKNNLDDLKRKQEEVTQGAIDFADLAARKEIELQKLRVQNTLDKLDDIAFETAQELAEGERRYTEQKKLIEANIKDEKTKIEQLKLLNEDYTKFLNAQKDITEIREAEARKTRLEESKKLYDELILAEQVLQEEIRFGSADTNDSLIALRNQLIDLRIKDLEATLDYNDRILESDKKSVTEYADLQNQKLALQAEYNTNALTAANRQADLQKDVELRTTIEGLEAQLGATIEYNKETKAYEVKTTKEKQDEINALGEDAIKERTAIEELAIKNITQTEINLNEEANVKKEVNNQAYIDANVAAEKKAQDEIFAYKLQKGQELIQIIQQFTDGITEINNLANQTELQNLTVKNEQIAAEEQLRIQQSYANLEAELAASNLTEEQKSEKRKQLEDANKKSAIDAQKAIDDNNRKLAKKQFERQKALNIVNALIGGAQAVMQGIAQFGPPPSPMGIASIVAAGIITAAQVASIASQKFDEGSSGRGTGINTSIPDTSTTASNAAAEQLQSMGGGFTTFNQGLMGAPGGFVPSTPFSGTQNNRVYVLESDITNTQNRVRVLEENSTFG